MKIVGTLLTAILLTGCIGPLHRYNSKQAKVDRTKDAIAANQQAQHSIGRTFTYAADQALKTERAPSPQVALAKEMTERSLLATGLPDADEAAEVREMVAALVSTNSVEQARGEKILAKQDAALSQVQAKGHTLDEKLNEVEAARDKLSRENAELAGKWMRLVYIKRWLIGAVIAIVVLWLASIILPIIFPELSAVRTTLRGVVTAIQSARSILQARHPEAAATLDEHLSTAAPPSSKQATVIQKLKTELGL